MEISNRIILIVVFVFVALLATTIYLGTKAFSSNNDDAGQIDSPQNFEVHNKAILIKNKGQLDEVTSGNAVVMFGHPGCGHCLSCLHDFEDAAGDDAGKSVFIAEYDNDEIDNDAIEKFDIGGFPTILKFKEGEKPIEYTGERTKEGFREFMDN